MALLEMTIKRDKYKRESLILDSLIFEKMHQFELWKSKFDIKPTLNLPSMKAISDVYGYTSGISVREPKSTALLLENAYGAEGGNGVSLPPPKLPFQPICSKLIATLSNLSKNTSGHILLSFPIFS